MVVFELLEAVHERGGDGFAVLRVVGEVRFVQRTKAEVVALKEDKNLRRGMGLAFYFLKSEK